MLLTYLMTASKEQSQTRGSLYATESHNLALRNFHRNHSVIQPHFAQVNTSTIAGTITDATGAAIANASITITGMATGQSRTVQSSDLGQYTLPQLAPGRYELKVEAEGFSDRPGERHRGRHYDQTQLNEAQFTTNSPPTYGEQQYNYTGAGLPTAQLGVNVLPVTAPAPITSQYKTPPGTLLFVQDARGRTPREYMWAASIQKSFARSYLFEVAYVGTAGRYLSKRYNADSDTVQGVLYNAVPGTIRFPNLSGILYSSEAGASNYQALETKLEKSFSGGWNLLSAYTYSHSIDNDSGDASGTPNLNPANFQLDKGPSAFDVRHRWVTSVLYELPVGKGKRFLSSAGTLTNLVVGGWQLNFITTYMSGLSTTAGSPDQSGVVFIAQRANATGISPGSAFTSNGATINPGQGFSGNNRALYWINPNAFTQTGPLQLGTSGRNVITGPASWNTDISMFKNFRIKERASLELRGEFFNVLNQVRFDSPNLDTSSPSFGQLFSAEPPRIIQLALRLRF